MWVTLHAITLPALPLAVILIAARWQRKPTDRELLYAFLPPFLLIAVGVSIRHLCHEGNAVVQYFWTGLAAFVALAFIRPRRWRRIIGVACLALGVTLGCHYEELVHDEAWCGNPRIAEIYKGLQARPLKELRAALADAASGQAVAPGWVRDSEFAALCEPYLSPYARLQQRVLTRVWHTPITWLFRNQTIPCDYWFVGGDPTDVEIRPRPGFNPHAAPRDNR